MQVGGLLTESADVEEDLLDLLAAFSLLLGVTDDGCQQLGNHVVQVLGQVVLCVYSAIDRQVTRPDPVLDLDVPDLAIQRAPELPHMSTNKEPTPQRRSSLKRRCHRQPHQLPIPGPLRINRELFILPEILLPLLLDLPANLINRLQRRLLHLLVHIEKPTQKVRDKFPMVIVLVVQLTDPHLY